eukprot:CAMPEP_0170453746 /NCGR_PEP_ID=MMETSP0123-20130129/2233_1 /TAXON_ID=182087 /ORGANISM="Favella ehrenbergii, Strain Fehren 1" /LENGTH=206 /DNA_ID=CAMNT_0010716237 /DNA_START=53 /DNA_END=673 /DNA_ORIENTATION=-
MLAAAEGENDAAIFWSKIGFILAAFAEGLIAGMIPTWSQGCRESPKVLGIANSFAAGVFLAIAFVHITPEMVETWEGLDCNQNKEKIFPLPEALIFVGYTIILMIDKVIFDTHALFDHDDGHGQDHDHDHDPATEVKTYETNTMKAVIAMNLYALFSVAFIQMNKVVVNMEKTTPLDLVLLVNIVMVIIAGPIIALTPSLSFVIPE